MCRWEPTVQDDGSISNCFGDILSKNPISQNWTSWTSWKLGRRESVLWWHIPRTVFLLFELNISLVLCLLINAYTTTHFWQSPNRIAKVFHLHTHQLKQRSNLRCSLYESLLDSNYWLIQPTEEISRDCGNSASLHEKWQVKN